MNKSLSWRIGASLFAILFVGSFVIWALWLVLEFKGFLGDGHIELADVSEIPVRRLVMESIEKTPDGQLIVVPSPSLRRRLQKSPDLEFAVLEEDGAPIPGGSSRLEAALQWMRSPNRPRFLTTQTIFRRDGDVSERYGALSKEETRFGWLFVATYGYRFEWSDLGFLIRLWLVDTMYLYSPLFILAALMVWLAVWQGLSPLRRAAGYAREIDIDHLNQRLPIADVPTEARPLIDALNDALMRLDAGVARERRFISNAAHELRTPISILRVRIDNPADETLRVDLRRHLRRLQMVVELLLTSARLAEKRATSNERVNLGELALLKVADYTPMIMESGRQIKYEGPKSAVWIRGESAAVESVMNNLLDNALRAEPPGGMVIVRVKEAGLMEICDHGKGIALAERDLAFEPFWRKSDDNFGSGLGLPIVKDLLRSLDAKIDVHDTPGGGATIIVQFNVTECGN